MKNPASPLTIKAMLLLLLVLALEGGYLLMLTNLLDQTQQQLARTTQARRAVAALAGFSSVMQSSTTAIVDQLHAVDPLARYTEIFSRLPGAFAAVKQALTETGEADQDLAALEKNVEQCLKQARQLITTYQREESYVYRAHAAGLFKSSLAITDRVERLNDKYKAIEESNDASLTKASGTLLYAALIAGFIVNALVALLLYMFFIRGMLARLSVVSKNMKNYAGNKPLLPPPGGNDEISALDQAFRKLVGNLEAGKTKEAVILENSSALICSINREGSIQTIPDKSSAVLGYTPGDLIGRRFLSLFNDTTTGDTYRALKEAEKKPTRFQNQVELPDGRRLDLSWSARAGDDSTIVLVAHDVSERKRMENLIAQSEAGLRRLIDNLPMAVVSTDGSGRIESANRAASGLSQYEAADMVGRSLADLFVNSGPEETHHEKFAQLLKAASSRTVNVGLCRADKSVLPIELDITNFTLHSGEKYLACFRDVSYRMEIEQAKRDFISMITHDLRSPLTALFGTLTMIGADCEPSVAPVFQKSETTVKGLIALINDFMTLGKLEAGQDILEKSSHRWTALLDSVCKNNPGCRLLFDQYSADPEVAIVVDKAHLTAVITYLIVLQRYFSSTSAERVVHVAAQLTAAEQGGEKLLRLKIDATGARLPQLVKDTCREGYGLVTLGEDTDYSPLHLALCRAIVQAHRGSLQVLTTDSDDCFVLTLPA
ncbi:MAG: PAS domain S-box protein [Cyanobacteria bacterium SZAS LIN-3]|nr:PAS domain S-box protein [Cyanobacteria bacterium SZAS LIN-3]